MIFFHSGNGNTAYAAHAIAPHLNDKCVYIPHNDPSAMEVEGDSVGFMFPVYSWGVPPLVVDFVNNLSDEFIESIRELNLPVWIVCTCGDDTGYAPEMLENILKKRGLEVKGMWSVIMPNTYVVLPGFDVDSTTLEIQKITNAKQRLQSIAIAISKGEWQRNVMHGRMAGIKTRLIYPLFVRWGMNPSRWHWTEECVQCGRCAIACPVGNITMRGGHPVWGRKCISCMACYHKCPAHAVAYGSITEGKGQYRWGLDNWK